MNTPQNETAHPKKHPGKAILIGVVTCLCLLAVGLVALNTMFPQASPQEEIQALLEERAEALSRKDLDRYLLCFSPQYQDGEQGGVEQLNAGAMRWFAQFESIQFSFQTLRREIYDTQALVENDYTFTLRPPEGDILTINKRELLELRREKTGWKIFKTLTPQS